MLFRVAALLLVVSSGAAAAYEVTLGGTLIAAFDGARIEPGAAYDVVVTEQGKELARAFVDLASLR